MIEWVRERLRPLWWHKAAACRGADSDLFFLRPGKPATEAKALCSNCPVHADALIGRSRRSSRAGSSVDWRNVNGGWNGSGAVQMSPKCHQSRS